MSPSPGFANVDWKKSCKSTLKGFNARSDAEQALQSCFFVLKMSPELQLSQGRSEKLKNILADHLSVRAIVPPTSSCLTRFST